MKMRSRFSLLASAVAAVTFASSVHAADLRWDGDGVGADATDIGGSWDNASLSWNDAVPANVTWTDGSNAIFGDPLNTVANAPVNTNLVNVSINSDIVANDIYLNNASNGGSFTFDAPSFNSLTINGNIIKNGNAGPNRFDLLGGPFVLGAGDHVIALRDSPGGALPEMAINANISGNGGIILDNRLTTVGTKESWGTLTLTGINSYAGKTQVKYGRLNFFEAAGLGATGAAANTIISEAGNVAIGGPGVVLTGPLNLNVAEDFTIQRSVYTGGDATDGGAFSHYNAAITSEGGVGTTTLSGIITVDSTDARIAAYSSNLVVSNPIVVLDQTLAAAPQFSVQGDFAGFVKLAANNTQLTNGVRIVGAQLDVDNDNQIGGASAKLFMSGGVYHPVNGYATDFGSHDINEIDFNGSINVDAGKVFNINQPLGPALGTANTAGSLSKRGTGTMNISSPVNLRGGFCWWDGGIVNVTADMEIQSLHLRSPTVNITSKVTGYAGWTSVGSDTFGTDGGPDIATVNISGNGQLIQTNADDFNVSDNANTQGTINISDNGRLETSGINFIGKRTNAVGTVNMTGGEIKLNRTGNFTWVLADARGGQTNVRGTFNMSGGTFISPGEVFVGEGGEGAVGTWNQSAGTATISNWFVVGRESGSGDVDLSGTAMFIRNGDNGRHNPIGEGTNARGNTFKVRGNATADFQAGEVWVSNGNTTTTMTIQDSGTVNGNNYFVIGRFGNSKGILNMSGGTLNKAGGNPFIVAAGGGSNGIVNQTGGTFNNLTTETWISDGGLGVWNVSGGTINSGTLFDVGHNGGDNGTLNVSGTAVVNANTIRIGEAGTVNGTVNMNGGTIKASTIVARASTGTKTFNFNAGKLSAGSYSVGAGLTNTGTGRLSPGIEAVGANAITGTYTQGATAGMDLDLESASSFDTVAVTGAATVAGDLKLTLLGGYSPVSLTPHAVVTGAPVSGVFNSIAGVAIGGGRGLAVTYSPTAITVTATQLGDANVDGKVNFDDLLAVAQHYNGTAPLTWSQGDFGGDALVNFTDLLALAQNYGFGTLNAESMNFASDWALAQSMVPEPMSLTLLGLGALAIRRRRA